MARWPVIPPNMGPYDIAHLLAALPVWERGAAVRRGIAWLDELRDVGTPAERAKATHLLDLLEMLECYLWVTR